MQFFRAPRHQCDDARKTDILQQGDGKDWNGSPTSRRATASGRNGLLSSTARGILGAPSRNSPAGTAPTWDPATRYSSRHIHSKIFLRKTLVTNLHLCTLEIAEYIVLEDTCLLSTAECNNRLPCSARLVYSSQYNDQKVRHVVYSAQYVILKRK